MKILTSWDDGGKLDLKIAELLLKYELDGIFFLPNIGLELTIDEIKKLSYDFEIGGHTVSHPEDLKRLSDEEALQDIGNNKEWLESIIGKQLEWFCYPSGRYNERTIEIVKKLGYKKARTTWVSNYKECENKYRIHPTIHVKKDRPEYKGRSWLEVAKEQYKLAENEENSYYHIWGHSAEVEEQQLWGQLEQLFEFIYGNKHNRSNDSTNQT